MKFLPCSRTCHVLLCLMFPFIAAQACGPFFYPDVFTRSNRPDAPAKYVTGHIGLIQPSFPRADLLVAYRYLNDGTLNAEEQKGWSPTFRFMEPEWMAQMRAQPSSATALTAWVKARADYPDAPAGPIGQDRSEQHTFPGGGEYEINVLNCSDDAFATATATLADRAERWGKDSAALRDWIHAQDTVFADCSNGTSTPLPAPEGSPALLVWDRAYQTAAAHFYAMSLDAAKEEFVAISKENGSPWQPMAGYLAARTMVRQAFFQKQGVDAQDNYDPAGMRTAAAQLRSYLAGSPPAAYRAAAESLLALIRIRIDPAERMRELSALVGGPGHDAHYAQDLKDILWRINLDTPERLRATLEAWGGEVQDEKHPGQMRPETQADVNAKLHDVYMQTATERAYSPLIDWTLTLQSLDPAAADHARTEWERTHSLPWLIAALMQTRDSDSPAESLLNAAAAVPVASPAWQTVTYHRVRLLLDAGRAEEARAILAEAMPRVAESGEPSSMNAFRGLSMRAAPTLAEFLKFAPRTILLKTSEEYNSVQECGEVMKDPKRRYNCVQKIDPLQLDGDATDVLNHQAPLTTWLAVAQSPALSLQLRQAVSTNGWTRAVLLHDESAARAFRPLLPEALRAEAGDGAGFSQWLVLARNPGLNPYLNSGTQRSYSYDFVESYRDNWCYKTDAVDAIRVSFLSPGERQAGMKEANALASVSAAVLGQKIVDYVSAHPDEPRAAEALFLILRMIRYGCTSPAAAPSSATESVQPVPSMEAQQLFKLRQDAARLLRERYATSPWTKKAAPFVG